MFIDETKWNHNQFNVTHHRIGGAFLLPRSNKQNGAIQSARWLIRSAFYSRHLQQRVCVCVYVCVSQITYVLREKGYYVTSRPSDRTVHSALRNEISTFENRKLSLRIICIESNVERIIFFFFFFVIKFAHRRIYLSKITLPGWESIFSLFLFSIIKLQ